MKQAYLIKQGVEELALAREQFAVIVAQLRSAAMLGMEHGEVERLVSGEGTELLRRLLQATRRGCGAARPCGRNLPNMNAGRW